MKKLIQIIAYGFLIYVWLFWLGHLAHGQTQTTVTGVVFDSGGNPATSGFVEFDLQPQNAGVQFFVSGIGVIAPQNTVCGIDGSGNVKNLANLANPCLVWGNSVVSPANTTYTVQIAPGGVVSNVVAQECINGATYSLAAPVFCPRLSLNPQSAFVITTPIQQNLIPGVDAVFNLGSLTNRYANVFGSVGTFNQFGGTPSFIGSPSFPAGILIGPSRWQFDITANTFRSGSTAPITWSSNGFGNGTSDTGLSRTAAGVVTVGNGTQADVTGTFNAAGYQVAGVALAASNLSNGVSGSGSVCLTTNCVMTTPTLGVASATSINKVALTAPATGSTLTIANGKTLTANSSLTLTGTDSTTMTFPTTSATIARTDAAQTFTGHNTFEGVTPTGATGTGNMVFSAAPTITSPTINTGVSQGSGFKHQRFGASCTTAAAAGAACNSTYTWTSAFPDTSYTVVCWVDPPLSGFPVLAFDNTKAAGSVTVTIVALTAAVAQAGGVSCIAIHD